MSRAFTTALGPFVPMAATVAQRRRRALLALLPGIAAGVALIGPTMLLPLAAALAFLALANRLGGRWRHVFHPAMLAVAVFAIAFPDHPGLGAPALWSPSGALIAGAWTAGGVALLAFRQIHWRAPLAMLVTALTLSAVPGMPAPSGQLALIAWFVATDTQTGSGTPVGRSLFGLGAALLAATFSAIGLPAPEAYAVLLMNALTPLLDRFPPSGESQ